MFLTNYIQVKTCSLCAEIRDRCATDCGLFENNAPMQACAEVCRRCVESCRQMTTAEI